MTEVFINIIAYEECGSCAIPIATFSDEAAYLAVADHLEAFLKARGTELSESAEWQITIPDVEIFEDS